MTAPRYMTEDDVVSIVNNAIEKLRSDIAVEIEYEVEELRYELEQELEETLDEHERKVLETVLRRVRSITG